MSTSSTTVSTSTATPTTSAATSTDVVAAAAAYLDNKELIAKARAAAGYVHPDDGGAVMNSCPPYQQYPAFQPPYHQRNQANQNQIQEGQSHQHYQHQHQHQHHHQHDPQIQSPQEKIEISLKSKQRAAETKARYAEFAKLETQSLKEELITKARAAAGYIHPDDVVQLEQHKRNQQQQQLIMPALVPRQIQVVPVQVAPAVSRLTSIQTKTSFPSSSSSSSSKNSSKSPPKKARTIKATGNNNKGKWTYNNNNSNINSNINTNQQHLHVQRQSLSSSSSSTFRYPEGTMSQWASGSMTDVAKIATAKSLTSPSSSSPSKSPTKSKGIKMPPGIPHPDAGQKLGPHTVRCECGGITGVFGTAEGMKKWRAHVMKGVMHNRWDGLID